MLRKLVVACCALHARELAGSVSCPRRCGAMTPIPRYKRMREEEECDEKKKHEEQNEVSPRRSEGARELQLASYFAAES